MCRCLFVVLFCFSSTALAQSSRRSTQFPGTRDNISANNVSEQTDGAVLLEQPQFSFTIQLWTTSERIIEAVLAPPAIQRDESPVASPFEGWEPHSAGKTLQIRSFETRVMLDPEIAGSPALIELSDQQRADFIDAAQGDSRSNVITAPKLTVFCEQVGSIEDETKIAFQFTDSNGQSEQSTALEGTRIFVRATRREGGEIEADAKIELHSLPNRHDIPITDDGALSRPPEQTVTTMGLSGIVRGEKLTMALVQPKPTPEPEKPLTLIQRAGFRRKEPHGVNRVVALVTVERVSTTE